MMNWSGVWTINTSYSSTCYEFTIGTGHVATPPNPSVITISYTVSVSKLVLSNHSGKVIPVAVNVVAVEPDVNHISIVPL